MTLREACLQAVRELGSNAYGLTITKRVEELRGRSVSLGAVYVTLDALVDEDILRAQMGEGTPERGGRRKRYYYFGPGHAAVERSGSPAEEV